VDVKQLVELLAKVRAGDADVSAFEFEDVALFVEVWKKRKSADWVLSILMFDLFIALSRKLYTSLRSVGTFVFGCKPK
jgi:uncharacterized membrane protein (DUF485 family)